MKLMMIDFQMKYFRSCMSMILNYVMSDIHVQTSDIHIVDFAFICVLLFKLRRFKIGSVYI
jgi:hypothetical protein